MKISKSFLSGHKNLSNFGFVAAILVTAQLLSACVPQALPEPEMISVQAVQSAVSDPAPTPLPTRPPYQPGELVDYTAQAGDTLPALAAHFNTTEAEIRQANPIIPEHVTTMPPGMPMKIPIYYMSLWGSPYQIVPDALFANGPAQTNFDVNAYIDSQPGWLKNYRTYAFGDNRTGAEVIQYIATEYSISPRFLLALLEYQTGALTHMDTPGDIDGYALGYQNYTNKGLYMQLIWAANLLNNGYYGWRVGTLREINLSDGRIERPDPWQNAATVALHLYYSNALPVGDYDQAINSEGFTKTYTSLFGDPWTAAPEIPGSLEQPSLRLPFLPGKIWALTGGPHTGWGNGYPLAALDFAPPLMHGGCTPSDEFVTAMTDGVIVRTETGLVILDVDGDGDEHTGWEILYLHIASQDMIAKGTVVKTGDPIGHPSCEGGDATGTHVHIARKYNGEWVPADGPLAFNLEGWIAHNGAKPYLGSLTRFNHTITANDGSSAISHIQSDGQ